MQTLKSKGSTFARSGSNDVSMAYFRKEAQTQGVTSVKVVGLLAGLLQPEVHPDRRRRRRRAVRRDVLRARSRRRSKSPPVKAFLNSVGKANADGFGAQAWIAALFFQDVVNKIVKAERGERPDPGELPGHGQGRARFTAQGMIGPTDVGGKVPDGLLRAPPAQGRQVEAGLPDEGGDLRLQQEEHPAGAVRLVQHRLRDDQRSVGPGDPGPPGRSGIGSRGERGGS